MVVEEEEEDREVDLSRVGMMRTMTKKGPWLGRTGAPTAGAPCHTQHCVSKVMEGDRSIDSGGAGAVQYLR